MDSASNHGWQAHLRHNPLGMLGKHLMEAPDFAGAMAGSGILDAVISDPLWKDQPSSIRQADKAERTVTRVCLLHFQCCHVILKKNNLKVEILRFPSSKRFLFVCSWDRATLKKSFI